MDKRYQVFVSSTFSDLKDEHAKVIRTLMEMDCIPSGMELFPATDDEQWEFIKKVIDDCDYYLLIIGGRYGSTTEEGISYTEKEYDYAVSNDLKIIVLLHGEPDEIPLGKSEADPELRERLENFRDKASKNRLVKFWKKGDELPGLVALSLTKTIKTYPAIGWVRANSAIENPKLLSEINELRKKNEVLEEQIKELSDRPEFEIPNLAEGEDRFLINGKYKKNNFSYDWSIELSWNETFSLIAPLLIENPNDKLVQNKLSRYVFNLTKKVGVLPKIDEQDYHTVKIQFKALNLIETRYTKTTAGNMSLFWILTKKGEQKMMELRSKKKNS